MEILIVVAITAVSLAGIFALGGMIFRSEKISFNEFIASNLAQEGIEIVRSIRDSNWIAKENWYSGIYPDCAGGCRVQYNSYQVLPLADTFLLQDNLGRFQYSSGNPSIFKREITVQKISDDELDITSEVSWGQGRSVTAEDLLFNWK